MNQTDWDAICVGGGITSLAFGAMVVRQNPDARILVLDQHARAGGYASTFARPKAGAVFDCSLHKISGTAEGGNFWRLFQDLQLGDELNLFRHVDYFEACMPGGSLILPNEPDQLRRTLLDRFPADRAGIEQFFQELLSHGKDSYYQYQIFDGSYDADFQRLRWASRNLKDITVADAFRERFSDGMLREILSAPGLYVGGYPEDLSYLYFLHVVYATLCVGCAYVAESAQGLSDALARRIVTAGGQVKLSSPVQKISFSRGENKHRVATSKEQFFSKNIYINVAPHRAFQTLFEPEPALEPVAQKLSGLKPAWSTTTLYLTLDADPSGLGVSAIETMILPNPQEYCLRRRAELEDPNCPVEVLEAVLWGASPFELTNYHALNAGAGRVLCLNILDTPEHWPERRNPEYKAKKERARQVLLGRLYAAKPALEGHVVFSELASPLTYQRFTGNTGGSGYGALVGKGASSHNFHFGFPFKGVHFLSAWVAGSGYEAAFAYAEVKAKALANL